MTSSTQLWSAKSRRPSRRLQLGELALGGDAPIVVQSMNTTDTRDVAKTVEQIKELILAGCELTRVAVPDMTAAEALDQIVALSPIPIAADIHFDGNLALRAIDAGVRKIRINPGNMRDKELLREIARRCRSEGVVIRVGLNSGSVHQSMLQHCQGDRVQALVLSCLESREFMHSVGAQDLVLSVKSSDPWETIEAYRQLAKACDDPLHIGVTEAGTSFAGTIRSAVGLGTLLAEGIGDTLRVSLTGDPVAEIPVAIEILRSLGLRTGPTFIACPTCGRSEVKLEPIARAVEDALRELDAPITVAVMGCPVNGPGEARHADYGLAGGKDRFILFRRGRVLDQVPEDQAVERLLSLIADDLASGRALEEAEQGVDDSENTVETDSSNTSKAAEWEGLH